MAVETTIYLARHGETDWNRLGRWQGHTDVPLNAAGREQAQALAERLRDTGVRRLYTSDLGRAHETARIVAAALGLDAPVIEPGLRERGFGCFEGLTGEECAARFPDEWIRYRRDPRDRPPGAERQEAVVERMVATMIRIGGALERDGLEPASSALAISHGGALRAFVASITGTMPPPLHNGALFRASFRDGGFVAIDLLAPLAIP